MEVVIEASQITDSATMALNNVTNIVEKMDAVESSGTRLKGIIDDFKL
ncbi:MAG: hypothetical protein AB9856_01675 [Cellulosilyticaceae bacterium]